MRGKFSLDKSHLQLIAIIAMVIDHLAWAFTDLWSPVGQAMHIVGRLTIPIMCFFVTEGFRKTGNIRAYIRRLAFFAVISIVPFYMFFHEEFGYRQNIIFDYLLCILLLLFFENKRLKKWLKVLLVILVFAISILVGGWPVVPELFTLAFYYGKTFKEKAKWFVIINISFVAIISALSGLNQIYHFAQVDWTWYDRLYLLGFMLALPVLSLYNGQKGRMIGGRFFFYIFYPVHLLILSLIVLVRSGRMDRHDFYLGFHIVCLMIVFAMVVNILRARASRMQTAVIMFLVLEAFYIVGFIIEIVATTVETYYMAAVVEYFGELLMLVAFLVFASECGRIRIPLFIYIGLVIAALALDYSILRSPETGFFYSEIKLSIVDGYTKAEYVHSTGYYLSVFFILAVIGETFLIMINSMIKGTLIEKKRMGMLFAASMFIWIPYAITLTGLTGGYEVPGLGVVGASVLFTLCFYNYGSLDAVAIASANALGKAREGVIVVDDRNTITFTNALAETIVEGDSLINTNIKKNPIINSIFEGKLTEIKCGGRLYEPKIEEIKVGNYTQGYTLWFIDVTKHRELLKETEDMAFHDPLTGLYNRRQFEKLVGLDLADKKTGTLVISDMDNFKAVNDTFGHKRGDKVLQDYADILLEYPEETLYPCRIGGDEFMFYLRGMTERSDVEKTVKLIMEEFDGKFIGESIKCTLSMGISINTDEENFMDLPTMYKAADEKLYIAKDKGKNTYVI